MTTDPVTSGATTATASSGSGAADQLSQEELRQRAAVARHELASTLDAIEYKLNVPRQIRFIARSVSVQLRKLGREKPLALAGVAAGVAAVMGSAVGGTIWGAAQILRRRGDHSAE